MSGFAPPPIYQPMVDSGGNVQLQWMIFFNALFQGAVGQAWSPLLNSLTQVGGTPKVAGNYYQIGSQLALFTINVTPPTGPSGSTTSVAGTTYASDFPLNFNGNGICFAVSGNLGTAAGMVDASTQKIWVPGWSAVTVPLTVMGLVEAS